jgi:hypothetical protein
MASHANKILAEISTISTQLQVSRDLQYCCGRNPLTCNIVDIVVLTHTSREALTVPHGMSVQDKEIE